MTGWTAHSPITCACAPATTAEAKQNHICAYLSIALLAGLLANALFGWWCADPGATLVIAAIAAHEGREAWRGGEHSCC